MISTVNLSGLTVELSQGTALPRVAPPELVQKFVRAMSAAQHADFQLQQADFQPYRVEAVDAPHDAAEPAAPVDPRVLADTYNPMTAVNVIHLRA
jgi:hypothetical protein